MATGTDNTTVSRESHEQQVGILRKNVTFGSSAETVTVGHLPPGAIVYEAGVVVATAFNSGTSDTLDIGTSSDTNGFATLLDLTTAGRIVADELATSDDIGPYSSVTEIQAVYTPTGTAATAGSAEVYVLFIPDVDG